MPTRKKDKADLSEFRHKLLTDPQALISKYADKRIYKAHIVLKTLSMRENIENLPKIKESCHFFCVNFVRTFDEEAEKVRTYPDYPYLKNIVLPTIFEPGNHLWEKAQRTMITISFCAAFLWAWLTWDTGFMAWMTSRMEDSVYDSGPTWKSLFGKMRFMYERILKENGWLIEHFLGQAYTYDKVFSKNHLHNPKNGNLVIGEAPKPGTPTGEGYVVTLVDECALVPQMNAIHGNLMLACKNNHYVGYPWGMNNTFAEIRHAKGNFGFKIVEIDSHMNPEHGEAWLAKKRETMTDTEFMRRLKRSYNLTTAATVWKKFSRDKSIVNDPQFDWNSIQLWWDFGYVDATAVAIVYITRIEINGKFLPAVIPIDDLEVSNQNYREVAEAMRNKLQKMGYFGKMLSLECWGDQQVKQTLIDSGSTMQERYKTAFQDNGTVDGFMIKPAPVHDTRTVLEEIDVWLSQGRFVVSSQAVNVIESMEKWTWPVDSRGNLIQDATQPAHNQWSHMGKAIEYGMVQFFTKKEEKKTPSLIITHRTMDSVMGGVQ
jgi:hypothetical protein